MVRQGFDLVIDSLEESIGFVDQISDALAEGENIDGREVVDVLRQASFVMLRARNYVLQQARTRR